MQFLYKSFTVLFTRHFFCRPVVKRFAMPYATRKMIKYMKEHKMDASAEKGDSESSNADGEPGDANKKIREQPSVVNETPEGSKMASKSPDSKASSLKASSSKITSKKSKSKIKSVESTGAKDAISKAPSKSSTKLKKSRSKQSLKSSKSKTKRKVKTIPDTQMALKPVVVPGMKEEHEMTFDQKKVQFIQMLLKANVKKLKETEATEPTEEGKKQFNLYDFKDKKKPLDRKPHSAKALYQCHHKSFPDLPLVVKVYDANEPAYDPHHSHYLKMLRHLSKKHPNIVQTWDVIHKDDSVYVFQELAPFGNLVDYMKSKGGAALPEKEVQQIACQLRMGMDFLGDMGLAHRSLIPWHILVMHKDMRIKLTGFRKAVIYYNEKKNDINYQPCRPLEKKKTTGNDYHAPESYGDHKKEFYDVVAADVWSAGATLFHVLTNKFPYNCSKNSPKIENEIQRNIRSLKVSDNAKSCLGFMLTTDATKRISVESLSSHPWFVQK